MHAYISINFKGAFDRDNLDFGALTITHISGRSYILDVDTSWEGDTDDVIVLSAGEDFDTFPYDDEYPYDLTHDDIVSGELKATLFIGGEDATEVKSIVCDLLDAEGTVILKSLIVEEEQ